ncbi:MAG TPA: glycosyltransferase family 39 protein, partial [Polyangiaceae bacterium]|nr:glycosyltransferase family 39 protein [Polyangiaceae bacterium]
HSGLWLVLAARLVMILLALAGTVAGIEYARRLAGKSAALIAAFALALFPPLLVYSHRTLQEAASAPLVVLVPLLLLERGPRAAMWAGVAAGVATLLRFQCAMLAATFFVGLVFQQRWADLRAYTKAGALVALGGGLLDWFTWGRPFHSFIAYIEFNLIKSGASTFGVAPRSYFAWTLWTSSGPAILLVGVGLVVGGIRRAPAAFAAVALFVLLHSAIPHKEFRFILPIFPLMLAIGAAGIADLLDRYWRRAWAAGVVTGVVSLAFIKAARGEHYANLGQYLGTPRANDSVWDTEEEPNLLLADAGVEPDVCGVLMLGVRAAFTGGYSYLHRHVPLFYRFQACDESKSANYVIAARDNTNIPPEFHLVHTRHGYGLYHRDGTCAPPPADYSGMLDGADDMGLGRAPIIQPDPHELRISAGSSAAAFVHGFGNGEHLECRLVRWAVDTKAQMAFPLQPTGTSYSLTFTAQPYYRSLPQAVRVALNGHALGDFDLEEGWRGYQSFVQGGFLRSGRNVVDFTFTHAARAERNDTRHLAALFDQIALAPADTSVHIDAGTSEARAYLASGFSGDERNRDGTFVWSDGPKSVVTVTLRDKPGPTVFQVDARAYQAVAPLAVDVSVNGKRAGALRFGLALARSSALLPAGTLQVGHNTIELSYAKTAKPSEHERGS